MPNGLVGPGNVCPCAPVPIKGLIYLRTSLLLLLQQVIVENKEM
tara:strand:- start:514 stop:645 length:132 start_codon:yes stop_codon:yes gene_type:complete